MTQANVHLTNLSVWNLKCFEHAQWPLGRRTRAYAENGRGKTSFVRIIEHFFAGGSDPGLIRQGCEEGRAVLEFSHHYSCEYVQKQDGCTRKVYGPEGEEIKAPAAFITKLLPRDTFDPAELLSDDGKRRAKFLLESMPVVFPRCEINAALEAGAYPGIPSPAVPLPEGPPLALNEFQDLAKEKTSARARIGSEIDSLRGARVELEGFLPKDDGMDWKGERARLQEELTGVERELASIESSIDLEAEEARGAKEKEVGVAIAVQQKIIADAQAEISRMQGDLKEYVAKTRTAALQAKQEATNELTERQYTIKSSLERVDAKVEEHQKAQGVKQAIDKKMAEHKNAVDRYEQYSAILKALDKLSAMKLKALDIPGFDVKFEKTKGSKNESAQLYIDGLPLDEINTQKAIFICLQMLDLAQNQNQSEERLPLFILETKDLTSTYREDLEKALDEAGRGYIITIPEAGSPLRVEVLPE